MSGTSTDGLTWVCMEVRESRGVVTSTVLQKGGRRFDPTLKSLLLSMTNQGNASLASISRAHWGIGRALVAASRSLRHEVDFAVFSGHTLYHEEQKVRAGGGTLQIGAVEPLALSLGKPVLSDMRYTDVAAGGMGAPLVPAGDSLIFPRGSAVLNIGGIANITLLRKTVSGFDTGPGNMLIDGAMRRLFGKEMDRNGKIAASGHCDERLLRRLMTDTFVRSAPPKTCGRERYGSEYVDKVISMAGARGTSDRDIITTLSEFTVRSILYNLRKYGGGADPLIIAGGGAYNRYISDGLRSSFDGTVHTSSSFGITPDVREAVAFGLLGYLSVNGRAANTAATGARRLVPLGRITVSGLSKELRHCL